MECKSKTCEFITEILFPFIGIFTSYFIYLSPLKEILPLYKKRYSGEVCNINPYPSVMVFCNALCQCLYSFVIHNHWLIWHNLGGTLLGLFYVVVLYSSNLKKKDFYSATITLIGLTFLNLACGGFSFIRYVDDFPKAKVIMGVLIIVILCGVYVSPLATIYQVIKTRNSSSINFIMTVAIFINSILWTVYGFFYNDIFIWFPNFVGVISSILQFILFIIFPRKPKTKKEQNTIEREQDKNEKEQNKNEDQDISEIV